MVVDIEPVAHVCACAVDRQRLTLKAVEDDEWDELLGEVVRAVVVRAVGDEGGQTIGVVPSADQVVAGSLAGRVRRVGGIWGGLGEEAGLAKGAVDFVGGDVLEAEGGLRSVVQAVPVLEGGLQERGRAEDVGADELARTVDGAIDM